MLATQSLDSVVKRLRELDGKIRKFHPGGIGEPGWDEHLRNLINNEWEEIERAINEHELPCRLLTGAYGFSLAVHAHGEMPDTETEALLLIDDSQFPFPSAKKGFAGQEQTLHRLSRITHRPRNQELLAFYGFEALQPAEHYAY